MQRHESLATLGDSLALFHVATSATGLSGGSFDVGVYEHERHHPDRGRRAGTVRRPSSSPPTTSATRSRDCTSAMPSCCPPAPNAIAPRRPRARSGSSCTRTTGSLRRSLPPSSRRPPNRRVGARCAEPDSVVACVRALLELVEDSTARIEDVLVCARTRSLVHWTHSGTDRASGGAFERRILCSCASAPMVSLTRIEQFEADAPPMRSRASTRWPPSRRRRRGRRVRPNAATAHAARLDAASRRATSTRSPRSSPKRRGRRPPAAPRTTARECSIAPHPAERPGAGDAPTSRSRRSATRSRSSAYVGIRRAAAERTLDVGAYEHREITLIEVDARGVASGRGLRARPPRRCRRPIVRAPCRAAARRPRARARRGDRALGRRSCSLPSTPIAGRSSRPRSSSSTTGRRVAPGRGAERPARRSAHSSKRREHAHATSMTFSICARTRSSCIGRTSGTDRAGGGAFERRISSCMVFGADGLLTRWSSSNPNAPPMRSRASTRWPRCRSAPSRRVRPNAATAHLARVGRRDLEPKPRRARSEGRGTRRSSIIRTARATTAREASPRLRSLFQAHDLPDRHEPLATLGDSLVLSRLHLSASAFAGTAFDVGAYEREQSCWSRSTRDGRGKRTELFAPDHLGDAIARLYERYAESLPEGSERERAAAIARSIRPSHRTRPEPFRRARSRPASSSRTTAR